MTDRGNGLRPAVVLSAAIVALLFANGRHTVAIAAWLAPLFLLRFVRTRPPVSGLLVGWLALAGTWSFQFRGMAPLPPLGYALLSVVYGAIGILPFVADRLLAKRVRGLAATFVFPCAWVGVDYLVASWTPYGSWGNVAYTQHESLVLMQLVSVTGLWGIGFLVAWCASVVVWAWERRFAGPPVRRALRALAVVTVAIFAFGGLRLALAPPRAPTVRVAGITAPDLELFPSPDVARRAAIGEVTPDEQAEIRARAEAINDDLLTRSAREARAGASLVVWGEANAFVFKDDERKLFDRAAATAREHGIHLAVGLATWNTASPKPLENKVVLFAPDGAIRWEFWKANPVPGAEAAISAVDDGRIPTVATPHGNVGSAICFDMDFPWLLRQAGEQGADILLAPSNDWRAIDPWHSHMARFRAVEQGFNLVRQTSRGLSIATDYQGRVLASMDHYVTETDRVLVAQVPTRGVRTIYARVGDVFAWACLAGLVVLPLARRRPSP